MDSQGWLGLVAPIRRESLLKSGRFLPATHPIFGFLHNLTWTYIYASNIVKCVAKLLKTTYPRVNDMAMVSCRLISMLVILEIGIDLCQVKYQRHSRKRKYGTPKMDTKEQTLQSDAVFSGPKWHVRGVSLFSIQCVLDIAKTPAAAMLSIATWRDQGGLWKDCPVHPDGLGMSRVEGCSQPKNAIHMH